MSIATKHAALTLAIIPRAGRVPSDLASLECPMSATLLALGGRARLDAAHADVIRGLISSALQADRGAKPARS